MKNIRLSAYAFILGLLLSGCNATRVSYDYDKSIDFSAYKSFDFHQKGLEKLEMNDLDKRRIVSVIRQNLKAKGLKEDHTDAELRINILSFTKEKVNVDVYPYADPYGYGWYNPWWNGSRNSYISQYTEGTLIIDLVDARKNTLVWQGKGSGINLDDLEEKSQRIKAVIDAILAKFPPYVKGK